MAHISVVNLTKSTVSKKEITQIIKKIIKKLRRLKKFSFLKTVDLSVAFIGEGEMKKINGKYRKINKPTDELSFLLAKTKDRLSGEILLCPAIIKRKSYKIQDASFKFQYLLTHAFLHLCGYDHETDEDWRDMEKIAEKILNN